jgi:hypothetical protein
LPRRGRRRDVTHGRWHTRRALWCEARIHLVLLHPSVPTPPDFHGSHCHWPRACTPSSMSSAVILRPAGEETYSSAGVITKR